MAGDRHVDLSVVVPVYKEEDNIRPFLARLEPVLARISEDYEILFCLDPSPDRTEEAITREIQRNRRIKLIVFSRRFGQPAATLAGIALAKGHATCVIDVDLQDPPELIAALHAKLIEGYDVVYAKRRSRQGETLVKRAVSWVGYGVINRLGDVAIPRNTGDFRIMSRRVCDELNRLHEGHGFLRGLVAYVGFPQAFVEYDRDPRHAGAGNYNRFLGSLKIGLNGLISFGSRPLQMVWQLGLGVVCLSAGLATWSFVSWVAGAPDRPGVSATVIAVAFVGGVQLLSLGVMGEYVGRIYDEVKRRPKYIVDRTVDLLEKTAPMSGEVPDAMPQEAERRRRAEGS
jgi:polyisoprenyl-phosphate glycosyltransferase